MPVVSAGHPCGPWRRVGAWSPSQGGAGRGPGRWPACAHARRSPYTGIVVAVVAVGVPGALWWPEASVRGRGVAPASECPCGLAGLLGAVGASRAMMGRGAAWGAELAGHVGGDPGATSWAGGPGAHVAASLRRHLQRGASTGKP